MATVSILIGTLQKYYKPDDEVALAGWWSKDDVELGEGELTDEQWSEIVRVYERNNDASWHDLADVVYDIRQKSEAN